MKELRLYEKYTREDVHSVFSPETSFTPQSGTWGLHGIVQVPGRPSCFVFFVTYGQRQGEHDFDERVSDEGILSWQSQPKQSFKSKQIQTLISHDELKSSIYLFLRTGKRRPYWYLGNLKYLTHDNIREKPVHFKWQILDWVPPEAISIALEIASVGRKANAPGEVRYDNVVEPRGLLLRERPTDYNRKGVSTSEFRAKRIDFSVVNARNRNLGLCGEEAVLAYEKRQT